MVILYCVKISQIILTQCACWGGSVLWQMFFLMQFIQHVSFLFFLFLKCLSSFKIISYLYCNMFPNKKKCLISQNTGCPIKTKEKNNTGCPWAALIFNSMLAVVVLYCVQLFFEANFPKSFFPLLCYSFCPLLSAFSWHPLLDFYGVSMGFL